jgi:cytochrome c5
MLSIRRMKRIAFALLFAAAAPAYAQQTPPAPPPAPPGQVVCTEPRPQGCTREYLPVCGTRRDGTRQTYGNRCTACADANVVNHIPGPCS